MRFWLLLAPFALSFVAACGGGIASSSLPPSDGPVQGTVVDQLGVPAPNVKLLFADRTLTTDAAGHFTIPYAPAKYDLAMAASPTSAYVFQGLASRTPTLRASNELLSPAIEHQASFTLDAQTKLAPSREARMLVFVPREIPHLVFVDHTAGEVEWVGDAPLSFSAYGLAYEFDPATHAPTRFVAEAELETQQLLPGATMVWNADFVDQTIPQSTVQVNLNLPAGWRLDQAVLGVRWRSASDDWLWFEGAATSLGSVALVVPTEAPSLGLVLRASSQDSSRELRVGSVGAGAPITVDVGAGPVARAPDDGANGIGVGAELAWSTSLGAASVVTLEPEASGPTYTIVSATGSVLIPDLSALGVVLPSGARYAWWPSETSDAKTTDDLATQGSLTMGLAPGTTTTASAASRSFTTP